MKRLSSYILGTFLTLVGVTAVQGAPAVEQVITENGMVEGTRAASGIRIFRGLPFATPPVGARAGPRRRARHGGGRRGRRRSPRQPLRPRNRPPLYADRGVRGLSFWRRETGSERTDHITPEEA